jgi:cation diffusion facilitator family transporter
VQPVAEVTALGEVQRIGEDNIAPHTRRLYLRASAIALLGNVLLLVAKGAATWISGSSAVYADAANSAADVAYSLFLGVGLWLSLRPPDLSHPHGHRRIEPLVSLVIGLMMALAGVQAALTGWRTLHSSPEAITSVWAYLVPAATVLAKWAMYSIVLRIGEEAHSPALRASAKDNLMDMVSSAAALIGVGASRLVAPIADPLAAFVVALWILRGAYEVLGEGVRQLTGGAAPPELTQAVIDAAHSIPGVLDVHQVIIEYVGPQVRADVHINMDGRANLEQVHEVSDAVRAAIEEMVEVDHAYIHVEPEGKE